MSVPVQAAVVAGEFEEFDPALVRLGAVELGATVEVHREPVRLDRSDIERAARGACFGDDHPCHAATVTPAHGIRRSDARQPVF